MATSKKRIVERSPYFELLHEYKPEPTMARFHASTAEVRAVMGPIGSGKSTGAIVELVKGKAGMQPAYGSSSRFPNGFRRSKFLLVRNTYGELRDTTLATFSNWVSPEYCTIKMSAPFRAELRVPMADGTLVECDFLFMALDKPKDVRHLLSLDLTGALIEEAREIPQLAVFAILSRLGRYPQVAEGGCGWSGAVMITNPPDDQSWWYRFAEQDAWRGEQAYMQDGQFDEQALIDALMPYIGAEGKAAEIDATIAKVLAGMKPSGGESARKDIGRWEFFRQPGALIRDRNGRYLPNPKAENVAHVKDGYHYWLRQTAGRDQEWINVHLLGEYGTIFSGKPVYEGFYSDTLHIAKTRLDAVHGLPIWLAFDFWHCPACIAAQYMPNGQLRLLREWYMESADIRMLWERCVQPGLITEFPEHWTNGLIQGGWGDPTGQTGDQSNRQNSCFGYLSDFVEGALPFPARENFWPCATNEFQMRRSAVIEFLTRMIGHDPSLLVCPSMTATRRALRGGYKFSRVQVSGDERYHDRADKNHPDSDLMDCLQYLCLGVKGESRVERDRREAKRRRRSNSGLTSETAHAIFFN